MDLRERREDKNEIDKSLPETKSSYPYKLVAGC
jgi:hypothetical protein